MRKLLGLAAVLKRRRPWLVIRPSLVVQALLGADADGTGIALAGRWLCLASLGVACWPGRTERASLIQAVRAMPPTIC